jgi:3-mercaptopyruvate sulfurtransferase SseA
MRASHLYFVARVLGYPAKIYVGSMADWTRDASRPVVKGAEP